MRYATGEWPGHAEGLRKGRSVRSSSKRALRATVSVALLALLVAVAAVAAVAHSSKTAVRGHMTPSTGDGAKAQAIGNPLASSSGSVHFGCQLSVPAGCYGPDQIRAAYSIQPLL